MNSFITKAFASLWLAALVGCSSTSSESMERDALISEQSPETSALLVEAIARLLNGTIVEITADAFVEESQIVAHRAQLLDRDFGGEVYRFRLVESDGSCFLILEDSGDRQEVVGLDCVSAQY